MEYMEYNTNTGKKKSLTETVKGLIREAEGEAYGSVSLNKEQLDIIKNTQKLTRDSKGKKLSFDEIYETAIIEYNKREQKERSEKEINILYHGRQKTKRS